MSQDMDRDALFTAADKFINLANELAQEDPSGTVGMALRYAAARYSAFETSLSTKDMAKEKDKIKDAFLKDYDSMLEENLQIYIQHIQAQNKNSTDFIGKYTP